MKSSPVDCFDPDAPAGVPVRYLHEGCSKMGDKTLVVTRTGSGWVYNCHRCGLHGFKGLDGIGGNAIAKFARTLLKGYTHVSETLYLPPINPDPPKPVQDYFDTWLLKYGLTGEDQQRYGYYTDINSRLVFPVYDDEKKLIYWTSRRYKQNGPKWINQRSAGRQDIYFNTQPCVSNISDNFIFLVEDIISAIKVGRICQTTALLGSYLDDTFILGLTNRFKRIIIWLDFDKRSYVIRKIKRCREFGLPVTGIFTKKDPKAYEVEEIELCINTAIQK